MKPGDLRAVLSILVAVHAAHAQAGEMPAKCGFTAALAAREGRLSAEPGGRNASSILSRPVLQRSVLVQTAGGPVRLHYDTSTVNTPALLDASRNRIPGTAHAFAESAAAAIRRTVEIEVVGLGYPMPPGDGVLGGGPEFDFYVEELGDLYGETVPETGLPPAPVAPRYISFTRLDNDFIFVSTDSIKGIPALQVTVAHEFHHAIQIGNYGYWRGDEFFYEITSVWMEESVYPGVDDYLAYLRSGFGHFQNPGVPFNSSGFIAYSRGIWGIYVAKRYGPAAMRSAWEEIGSRRALAAMDAALQEAPGGSGIRPALAEWALWNVFTGPGADTARYYPEGHRYPAMEKQWVEMGGSSRSIEGSLRELGGQYHAVRATSDTLVLITANINLAAAEAGGSNPFPFTYQLSTGRPDESYRQTAAGLSYRFSAPDPAEWYTWDVVRNNVGVAAAEEGAAFPNPFRAGRGRTMAFAVGSDAASGAALTVFTPGLTRVYGTSGTPVPEFGRLVLRWDGRTERGEPAASGVYFFLLEAAGRTVRGKFVLLQEGE